MLARKNVIGFEPLTKDINESRADYLERFFRITAELVENAQQCPTALSSADYDLSQYSRYVMLDVNCILFEQEYRREEIEEAYTARIVQKLNAEHEARHSNPAEGDYEKAINISWAEFLDQFSYNLPKVSYKLINLNNITYSFITVEFTK